MDETVRSAIVGEAIRGIFSGVISKYEDNSNGGDNIERLEMAQIKLEAAIKTSNKWQITDTPLLRWQKKLKRASEECDDTLRKCKQRALEEKEIEVQVKQSSFPRRVAHATKSFIVSFIGHNNDDYSSSAIVRRFERIADSADSFLRFVQLGGRPRRYLFFDPLIAHLFAGKSLRYQTLHDGSQYHFFSIRPMSFEERGLEAMLFFVYEDCKVPKNSFRLGFILRLSESTDVMGITVKCLQSVTPHFKSTAEIVVRELTQLPTQDFSWLPPYHEYGSMEHWDNVQTTLTQWFRPDPLCCSKGYIPACSSSSYTKKYGTCSLEKFPLLKLWFLFMPHDSVEDLEPTNAAESYALEAIDGEKQHKGHVDVHPHQLDEMLLPKAINYLYHNAEATTYQMYWKPKHGSAHLSVEKTSMATPPQARRTTRRQGRMNKIRGLQMQEQIKNGQCWKQVQRLFSVLQMVSVIVKFHSSFIHPSCSFPVCIKMVAIDGLDHALLDRSGVHAGPVIRTLYVQQHVAMSALHGKDRDMQQKVTLLWPYKLNQISAFSGCWLAQYEPEMPLILSLQVCYGTSFTSKFNQELNLEAYILVYKMHPSYTLLSPI
uniref:Uncharacterized protein n=1 Tax=Oryza glumipatula TaxID=40148 RepID=A0A0D9ZGA6_9ORYZ